MKFTEGMIVNDKVRGWGFIKWLYPVTNDALVRFVNPVHTNGYLSHHVIYNQDGHQHVEGTDQYIAEETLEPTDEIIGIMTLEKINQKRKFYQTV